ncbi:MAG: hypothetical protein R3F30_00630 [Planctomycetota bacterium]
MSAAAYDPARAARRAAGLARVCRAVGFATLAAIAVVAAFLLLRSLGTRLLDLPFAGSPLELPIAILVGTVWALRRERAAMRRARGDAAAGSPAEGLLPQGSLPPRAAPLALLLPLALVWPAMLLGCLDGPARSWDGLVAWELKTRSLHDDDPGSLYAPESSSWEPAGLEATAVGGAPTGLRQDDFYRHSPGHPLLQPYLMASLVEFVGWPGARFWHAWVWLAALCLLFGCARRGPLAALLWAGIPLAFSLGGGSVDSGYADGLVAFLLLAAGVGLLRHEPAWLVCALLALPLAKREGALWALLVAAAWLVARFRPSLRIRTLTCVLPLAVALVLALAPGLVPRALWLAGQEPSAGLSGLALALTWELRGAFAPNRFALLFVAALVAALLALAARREDPTSPAGPPLPWLTAAILCALPLPFVLFPAADLEHHLRSTMDRLLLQVSGLVCVTVLAMAPPVTRVASASSP